MTGRWLALLVVIGLLESVVCQSLRGWLTTGEGSDRLSPIADLPPQQGPSGGFELTVESLRIQTIDGFGAALTNAAAYVLHQAEPAVREAVLRECFDRETGAGMGYIRLTMGTSDLTWAMPYTYNDLPYGKSDFAMTQFSIDKDKEYVIPIVRQILEINPDVKIMASPYSLPAWMKDTRTLFGGFMRSEPEYQLALAQYFLLFIRAYQAEGITIDSITLINEARHTSSGYPTTRMSANLQKDVIRYHLGPLLEAEMLDVKIVIWDHNWDRPAFPLEVLADPVAKDYIAGTGWHCYGGDRFDGVSVREDHPEKDFYLTECSGGQWDEGFSNTFGWSVQNLMIGQTRIGARTVMYKSLVLDETSGPRRGVVSGCDSCRGVITLSSDGTWSKSPEFYATAHLSTFVRPGARNALSTSLEDDKLETTAFENPDGSVVVLVFNASYNTWKRFDLQIGGDWYNYNLAPRAAVTLVKSA